MCLLVLMQYSYIKMFSTFVALFPKNFETSGQMVDNVIPFPWPVTPIKVENKKSL
jgi:hypothetical protein